MGVRKRSSERIAGVVFLSTMPTEQQGIICDTQYKMKMQTPLLKHQEKRAVEGIKMENLPILPPSVSVSLPLPVFLFAI